MFTVTSGQQRSTSDGKGKSLKKTLSNAAMSLTGAGPALHKQLKSAIIGGDEQKAIAIYNSTEGGKPLYHELHLSQPFPSKKNPNEESPMHLTAIFGLSKLFQLFLEKGGRPGVLNQREETCLHAVCSMINNPFERMEIVEAILEWRHTSVTSDVTEYVPVDGRDVNGNAAIHLAAHHNLTPCVELLINYGAQIDLLNYQNLSCVEMADIAGHDLLGTMIELAWLFLSSDPRVENTPQYHKLAHDRQNTRLILNSHSLSATGLMDFVDQAVHFVTQATGETHSRAEVLLAMYRWDVSRLKTEYLESGDRVLTGARLASVSSLTQRKVASPTPSEVRAAEQQFGISIEDVFLDGCYANSEPFTIVRDGVASQYTVRATDGKTSVLPVENDPLRSPHDLVVSPESRSNPRVTDTCIACNTLMLERCDLHSFLSGEVVDATLREVDCGSGHKFCFSCWAGHSQAHVLREDFGANLGCLPCLSPQCGDVLDLQWAPLLLGDQGLLDRLHGERQRFIVDSIGLRWCPDPECGLLVHMSASNYNQNADANLPQAVVCANGHAFCLSCERDAHSPCSCPNLDRWMEAVHEEAQHANARDQHNPSNVLLGLPSVKTCPACQTADVEKVEGCSRMNCGQCHSEFCWTCLQPWSLHVEGQQCNRLVSPNQRGAGKEVWVEEKGV